MNNIRKIQALIFASVLAHALGCALTQPRGLHVWSTDRSDRVRQPHREFYICWSHPDVDQVKLEYRQTGKPDQIVENSQHPEHKCWIVFEIPQKDVASHGAICAWRVTLLTSAGDCVGQRKSVTWQ